jgi:hypothetical protein
MDSLAQYKEKAEAYVPVPPQNTLSRDPDSLISFDGNDYVSASKAAEITGYHTDYVGQLARGGTVLSRQIGNRWYVDRAHIVDHKREKDGLLARVQSEAVGLKRPESPHRASVYDDGEPFFKYTSDDRDLLPTLAFSGPYGGESEAGDRVPDVPEEASYILPIRVVRPYEDSTIVRHNVVRHGVHPGAKKTESQVRISNKYIVISGIMATIVIVFSVGVIIPKAGWVYTRADIQEGIANSGMVAGVATIATKVGDILEQLLAPELVYRRSK